MLGKCVIVLGCDGRVDGCVLDFGDRVDGCVLNFGEGADSFGERADGVVKGQMIFLGEFLLVDGGVL